MFLYFSMKINNKTVGKCLNYCIVGSLHAKTNLKKKVYG